MKPSQKAIRAMADGIDKGFWDANRALEAAYAIDVDPLLAAKDAENERLKAMLAGCHDQTDRKTERIAELEAEIERLRGEVEKLNLLSDSRVKAHVNYTTKRISIIEAENVRLKDMLDGSIHILPSFSEAYDGQKKRISELEAELCKRNFVLESLDTRSGTTDAEVEERERITAEEEEDETE